MEIVKVGIGFVEIVSGIDSLEILILLKIYNNLVSPPQLRLSLIINNEVTESLTAIEIESQYHLSPSISSL